MRSSIVPPSLMPRNLIPEELRNRLPGREEPSGLLSSSPSPPAPAKEGPWLWGPWSLSLLSLLGGLLKA